jgi:hypothetical protein
MYQSMQNQVQRTRKPLNKIKLHHRSYSCKSIFVPKILWKVIKLKVSWGYTFKDIGFIIYLDEWILMILYSLICFFNINLHSLIDINSEMEWEVYKFSWKLIFENLYWNGRMNIQGNILLHDQDTQRYFELIQYIF